MTRHRPFPLVLALVAVSVSGSGSIRALAGDARAGATSSPAALPGAIISGMSASPGSVQLTMPSMNGPVSSFVSPAGPSSIFVAPSIGVFSATSGLPDPATIGTQNLAGELPPISLSATSFVSTPLPVDTDPVDDAVLSPPPIAASPLVRTVLNQGSPINDYSPVPGTIRSVGYNLAPDSPMTAYWNGIASVAVVEPVTASLAVEANANGTGELGPALMQTGGPPPPPPEATFFEPLSYYYSFALATLIAGLGLLYVIRTYQNLRGR